MRKDDIMNIHLDLRLKNDSISKISERMKSLRHQAKKTADDFLWSLIIPQQSLRDSFRMRIIIIYRSNK